MKELKKNLVEISLTHIKVRCMGRTIRETLLSSMMPKFKCNNMEGNRLKLFKTTGNSLMTNRISKGQDKLKNYANYVMRLTVMQPSYLVDMLQHVYDVLKNVNNALCVVNLTTIS